MSKRTGSPLGLYNVIPLGARPGPISFTDYTGETHTCDTARFPGWVETPEGLDVGMVPAWCVDGRFLLGHSGAAAIHEAYSDIYGESLGFYYRDEGVSADYLVGGDFSGESLRRSLSDPGIHGNPDAYRDRIEYALTARTR